MLSSSDRKGERKINQNHGDGGTSAFAPMLDSLLSDDVVRTLVDENSLKNQDIRRHEYGEREEDYSKAFATIVTL